MCNTPNIDSIEIHINERMKNFMKFTVKESDSSLAPMVKSSVRINKKTATVLYIVLGIFTMALLVMAILASVQGKNADYPIVSAVAFTLLGGAIAVSLVAFNPRKSFYDIGFYLLHIGIVIFILGMMIFAVKGSSRYVSLPDISSISDLTENQMKNIYGWSDRDIDKLRSYRNQIGSDDGEIIDLGYNFRIADFLTDYYEDGESVRYYEATVEFFLSDGTIEKVPLSVNHPIYRSGWKIYLMNVGTSPYGYEQVNLLLKKDPAEFISVAGIILIILGTFMICILPKNSLKLIGDDKKRGGVTHA